MAKVGRLDLKSIVEERVFSEGMRIIAQYKPKNRDELDGLLLSYGITDFNSEAYKTLIGYYNSVTCKMDLLSGTDIVSEGTKNDEGKLEWSLIELKNLEPMLKVLMFGAKKYAPDNWKKVPDAKKRYYDAFMRHFAAYQAGEILDAESGLPHLDHAQCCLYFLSYFEHKDGKQ